MIVFPNAKINLGLNVVSKREDGYHNLETVFYPIPFTDGLEMAETGKEGLTVSGIQPDVASDQNLVFKAYRLLKEDFDLPVVRFHLHKVIPGGTGLGGGSADASFTLKMINEYFHLSLNVESLKRYASLLGADCPFFIDNRPSFAAGKGDILTPVNVDLSRYHIVLIDPGCTVSTKEAYENVIPAKPEFNLKNLESLPVEQWKNFVTNDFEKTIFQKYPIIGSFKQLLYKSGAVYASMSGSGSSVYGLFRSFPENIHKIIPKGILFAA